MFVHVLETDSVSGSRLPVWSVFTWAYSAGQRKSTNFLARELDFLRENGPRIRSQGG